MKTNGKELKKNWSMCKSIGTIILILLLFGGLAQAIPIDKKETIGPYGGNHRYYLHIYNVDDLSIAIINGNFIGQESYGQDSGNIDITNFLFNGENKIELMNINNINRWNYGFEIWQDNSIVIWSDICGNLFQGISCNGNDQTPNLVYHDSLTLILGQQQPKDRLNPGDMLNIGQSISSQNGQYKLIMQGDGNLVLYDSAMKPLWATGTNGKSVSYAIMQGDGNFVLYDSNHRPYWDSKTFGHNGAWLILQNDRNIVVYDTNYRPLWTSNTR